MIINYPNEELSYFYIDKLKPIYFSISKIN